jgi:protein-S-isoprenylcysteine O-methyltransferase Ste14
VEVSRALVQAAILIAWVLPAPSFIRGRSKSGKQVTRRDSMSRLGIVIQGIAFGLSWMGPWWMFASRSPVMHPALGLTAVLLAYGGSVLAIYSVRTLGREWSLTARITEGHRLITSGPYRFVRNPIYTAMWGLQLGTCMAFSAWWLGYKIVAITAVLYYAGTVLRMSREERLLRAEFGEAFDEYVHRVPALIPWRLGSGPSAIDRRP